jgi:hypothetical protein
MVAITVAIAATIYIYISGATIAPSTQPEDASCAVKTENGKIKITLTKAGNNMPEFGYSFANSVTIRLNGTVLIETGLTATNWDVGGSLFIGDNTPTLDDTASEVNALVSDSYSITVIIAETVIYEGEIKVK